MTKKIILHIGTEKTGSTSIQSWFTEHRAALLKRNVLYSSAAANYKTHEKLVAFSMDDNRIDDVRIRLKIFDRESLSKFRLNLRRELIAEIKEHENFHTLIFSTEHAHSRLVTEQEVKRLIDLINSLGDFSIKVVLYIRRQDLMAISYYSTALLAGAIDPQIFPANNDFYFDHFVLLERWSSIIGREKIIVRLFEKDNFTNNDLLTDFLHTIDLTNCSDLLSNKTENGSLDAVALKFLCIFNKIVPAYIGKSFNPDREMLDYVISKMHNKKCSIHNLTSRCDAQDFFSRFKHHNELVRRLWFSKNKTLFSEDFSMYSDSPTDINPSFFDAVKMAADIWREIVTLYRDAKHKNTELLTLISDKDRQIKELTSLLSKL